MGNIFHKLLIMILLCYFAVNQMAEVKESVICTA